MNSIKELDLQYLKTNTGEVKAVVIPIKEWSKFEKEILNLEKLILFSNGFRSAFKEIKKIKSGKTKKITLKEFLNEC